MNASPQHTPNPAHTTTPGQAGTEVTSGRRLLGKAQVAARLGCSERSLERLVKQGRFAPPRRYGRAVVWFEAAVEQFLQQAQEEQLQWCPEPAGLVESAVDTSAPSLIPAAHELEMETTAQTVSKPAKTAGKPKHKRAPVQYVPGESGLGLTSEQLSSVGHVPTLD